MDGKSKSAVVTLFRPDHNLEIKFPSLRPLVLPHYFVKEHADNVPLVDAGDINYPTEGDHCGR